MEDEERSAIVLDQGSYMLTAGYAGEDAPSCVFSSVIGRPLAPRARPGPSWTHHAEIADGSAYVGDDAQRLREALALRYPMERGVVRSWADLEELWEFLYLKELRITPSLRPVLMTVTPKGPRYDRERMLQIMMETFNVPGIYLAPQALLSFYASGRGVAITIQCGEGSAHVMPIWQGYTIKEANLRVDLGGHDLNDYMMKLLGERGIALTTSADREIVRDIKEKLCYVALDYEQELKSYSSSSTTKRETQRSYKLPDGQEITLGDEAFRVPELLFSPEILGGSPDGLADVIYQSIMRCDVDIRKDLYGNILLAGGSTMFPGMAERVTREMTALAPSSMRLKVLAPPERKYSAWIGGSILASLSTFQSMWITGAEYDEHGPEIVHRKCFCP